jgi:hypothetical protein
MRYTAHRIRGSANPYCRTSSLTHPPPEATNPGAVPLNRFSPETAVFRKVRSSTALLQPGQTEFPTGSDGDVIPCETESWA